MGTYLWGLNCDCCAQGSAPKFAHIRKLDGNGKLVWDCDLKEEISTGGQVQLLETDPSSGYVYAALSDGRLYKIDPTYGEVVWWVFQSVLSLAFDASGYIYVGTRSTDTVNSSGRTLQLVGGQPTLVTTSIPSPLGTPAGATSPSMVCLSPVDGSMQWRLATGGSVAYLSVDSGGSTITTLESFSDTWTWRFSLTGGWGPVTISRGSSRTYSGSGPSAAPTLSTEIDFNPFFGNVPAGIKTMVPVSDGFWCLHPAGGQNTIQQLAIYAQFSDSADTITFRAATTGTYDFFTQGSISPTLIALVNGLSTIGGVGGSVSLSNANILEEAIELAIIASGFGTPLPSGGNVVNFEFKGSFVGQRIDDVLTLNRGGTPAVSTASIVQMGWPGHSAIKVSPDGQSILAFLVTGGLTQIATDGSSLYGTSAAGTIKADSSGAVAWTGPGGNAIDLDPSNRPAVSGNVAGSPPETTYLLSTSGLDVWTENHGANLGAIDAPDEFTYIGGSRAPAS